jgi:hypothetical protein
MRSFCLLFAPLALASAVGCSSSSSSEGTSPIEDSGASQSDATIDGGSDSSDGGIDAPADTTPDAPSIPDAAGFDALSREDACASTFGSALPSGYGRIDGTILAVLPPGDKACTAPNSDHVVLEVQMGGAAYRVVVNVLSTVAGVDPNVRFGELAKALPAPAWADGFHAGVTLDYPTDLGVHVTSSLFVPIAMKDLVPIVVSELVPGAKVAVYAQGTGGDSVHLVHRVGKNDDGAIVVDPTGPSPRFMLFHFADQTF